MWLIALWGAVVPIFTAVDSGIRPATWTSGLGTGIGLLVVLVILSFIWPRFTVTWAMGFAGGSAISLVAAPIAGYPMLDIGFAIQGAGALGVMSLAARNHQRKQVRSLLVNPDSRVHRIAVEEAFKGSLVAPGKAHALLVTTKHMAGPGMAILSPDGPLLFSSATGMSHTLERKYIKGVEPVEQEDVAPGTLMISFTPPILLYGISITPPEEDREKWLALNPKETPSS
ncbi:hypothetical protein OG552_13025 [Streptomyces sp. NBC_01476]|uniref:hypothetical protein n=1 Tax=Streptomyces sp. NBC_01476 TaxID=2903881 RepID=UPI002E34B14C|nr:hypothetical protein [Streptomyces sp. NBC_01476]